MVTMTPNIGSLRKDFSSPQQQQSTYHQQSQQLLPHNNSPMKPKKRVSESSKKPKKRRSSSASDKENDTIATQQPQQPTTQQQQQTENCNNTTTPQATTNGYTNGHRSPDNSHLTTESKPTTESPTSLPSTSSFTPPTLPSTAPSPAKVYDPASMDFELEAAVELMTRFVSKTPLGKSNLANLGQFNALLVRELRQYYTGHWYPERPMRGSGHRCLRVNQSGSTSIIEKTANSSGNSWVLDCLPKEFTIWIDPGEVSYRIGEDGSICVHFSRPITRPTNTSKQG